MKGLFLSCLLLGWICGGLAADEANQLTAREKKEGWILLFNGKNLDGWEGDPELWSARDGMLVGSTEQKQINANTFLISRGEYADFVLRAQVRLRNHNSGIQFRSQRQPGPGWVVTGYQADLAQNNWWGSLYEEKGRGVLVNGWKGKGETVVRPNDWNDYEITARGDRITIRLNGLVTAELDDNRARSGVIALQLHSGPPMEVYFRNLKLRPLKGTAEAAPTRGKGAPAPAAPTP